ncbi:MAG TPA: DNA-binding domain-containing protein [Sphingomonas sp.]|jgi:hypothetical protein|nr:DNA-binding domain-containing protein [Sphingomonas sp.]
MTLMRLQHGLADYIHGRSSAIAADLADPRGLAVYHHAYRATLRACLRDTYARTAKWLGDEAFDAAADVYVAANPSHSWTLDAYGADFPDHLGQARPDDPEAAELAWLEGAMRRAFSAADAAPLDHAALAAVDWERATLAFAPGVAVRRIAGDVPGIWHSLEVDRALAQLMLAAPLGLVVWRADLEPRFRSCDPREAGAIMALMAGATFASACAEAAAEGADPQQVGAWLGSWLADGLVCAVGPAAQGAH